MHRRGLPGWEVAQYNKERVLPIVEEHARHMFFECLAGTCAAHVSATNCWPNMCGTCFQNSFESLTNLLDLRGFAFMLEEHPQVFTCFPLE